MKLQHYIQEILAITLIALAVLLSLHQRLFTDDGWFHFRQVVHFETIIACCIVGALAVVAGKYLRKLWR